MLRDSVFAALRGLSASGRLRRLDLSDCALTREQAAALCRLTSLRTLLLNGADLATAAGLREPRYCRRAVTLMRPFGLVAKADADVDPDTAFLEALPALQRLEHLELDRSMLGVRGVQEAGPAAPGFVQAGNNGGGRAHDPADQWAWIGEGRSLALRAAAALR